ncbi:uncharacterized protein [Coffea arabica]|uniref:Uncharacterized protein n=1 Tax=Coffea arabica TaxID=13443 RepID=A0A6P6UI87_COFAR|nr:centriolin-like [Coffea arabica]
MALQSAFRERLEHMEVTRNQRLSLLQSEKELQTIKSRDLASKLSNIRSMEQRCLKLDCKIASQHLVISSLESELHRLDSVYAEILQKIRTLKLEVEEMEELEKEKESYYNSQSQELEEFKAEVDSHIGNCQLQIQELRTQANELKSSFSKLQGSLNYSTNSEISQAETKKAELLAEKERLDKILASNYPVRDQLRKQLQNILADQEQKRKP